MLVLVLVLERERKEQGLEEKKGDNQVLTCCRIGDSCGQTDSGGKIGDSCGKIGNSLLVSEIVDVDGFCAAYVVDVVDVADIEKAIVLGPGTGDTSRNEEEAYLYPA